jgi:hypothetical protein
MIPDGLHRALDDGRLVLTDGSSVPTTLLRLADLVLPTGRVLLGYPGYRYINEPSPVRPAVAPGRYPVFASVADSPAGYRTVAFVVVRFEDGPPAAWEEAGAFFTDSGTGCLMDEGCVPLLEQTRESTADFWRQLEDLKAGVFTGGDCNLVLDAESGGNAIVFQTQDSRYPCFLGRGQDSRPVWLVLDCR